MECIYNHNRYLHWYFTSRPMHAYDYPMPVICPYCKLNINDQKIALTYYYSDPDKR